MRDLQAEDDGKYTTTTFIHETDTHPLMWCPPNPSSPSNFVITFFEHGGELSFHLTCGNISSQH